jgi:hypothetical protein
MGRAVDQAVGTARPVMEKAGETLRETGAKAKEQVSAAVDKIRKRQNSRRENFE